MFKSARIKLTAWYLLIIATISFLFSFTIYRFLDREIDRFAEAQKIRLERKIERRFPNDVIRKFPAPPPDFSDPDIVAETKVRILMVLFGVNGVIIFISGFLSYFLSGKTLQPIKDAYEKQDRFISDASHELRTPITALKTSIEVALRNKNLSLKESRNTLQEGLTDVDNLSTLANSLLELSRSESKKEVLNYQTISAKDIVETSIRSVLKHAASKKILINKKVGKTKIVVDKEKIERVLVILLDNAIKFSPQQAKVRVYTTKSSKYFTFHVLDHGLGISKQNQEKIFDRFFRQDSSRTTSSFNGFGLGLSIAKSIIDQHKGKISVVSTEGEGSVFSVKLPLLSANFQPQKVS